MLKVKLKYCGNKSLNDLQVSCNSNADYIGVIFADSKRKVHAEDLSRWLEQVDLQTKELVGVFVNESVDEIANVVSKVPLSIIQCHGTESPEQLIEIKSIINLPIWKAIHHSDDALQVMGNLRGIVDGFVIDSKVKGMWGGTGITFDWNRVGDYIAEAESQGVPCFIAGGIIPENITTLLQFHPKGIDLSSGIEVDGIKNKRLIRELEERLGLYETSSRS
ncbi:phosphoribosylanthranilate isomerase [Cytobacillus suaedae]|nr:phosphoribosylanthranilate isomerase [Cytobacillus suaedae]